MYTCPCCGFKTLTEKPAGTYEICGLCGWEDDLVQFKDPDFEGGANSESLREAQNEFQKELQTLHTLPQFEKDTRWIALSPPKKKKQKKNRKTDFIADDQGIINKIET